ncbi:hypothetical protein J7M28_09180 [bacterium]|nr:hypothetical protein [bacterium]
MKGLKLIAIIALAVVATLSGDAALAQTSHQETLSQEGASTCNSLVVLSASDISQMREAEQKIVQAGGYVVFRFPPHILYAWIPEDKPQDLAGNAHITSIFSGSLEPTAVKAYGRSAMSAVKSWNNIFVNKTTSYIPTLPQEPGSIYDDALTVPREGMLKNYNRRDRSKLLSGPLSRGPNDTSEFMLGNVAVAIILPESDGSIDTESEDWTNVDVANGITDRPQKVRDEILASLNWWVLRETEQRSGPPLLSFTIDPSSPRVRITGYEPISRSSLDEYIWVSEIMTQMGYTTGSAWQKVRQFDLDLIADLGADWAFTVFVYDSLNDSNGQFANGAFAYSYLGGPWLTMTYDNDGYSIHNMDAVCAHETGHSFYTLDEYPPGSGTPTDCHAHSGYLNIENLNSRYDPGMTGTCDANYGCIMRGGTGPFTRGQICPYTAAHVGMLDSDGDDVYDILDFCPHSELDPPAEDPTTNTRPTFMGKAWIDLDTDVLTNDNPADPGNDYTINVITNVEYQYQNLDAGPPSSWYACVPDDGAFDGIEERYHFTVASDLNDGPYIFSVRATILGGHVQGELDCPIDPDAKQYLTISTGPSGGQSDDDPPECHTPYPPCYGLSEFGPCYLNNPTLQPIPDWATSRTVLIGCTFTDRSWVDASRIQYRIDANGDYDYNDTGFDAFGNFWTEDWTDWDVEMPPHSDSKNIRVYSIVTYQTDGPDLHFEWRAPDIDMEFDESNGYTYAGRLNRTGMMDDWRVRIDSDPPHILSASAADTSGGGIGIQEGDTVTIRFDEETNGLWLNETNVDYIISIIDDTMSPAVTHTWGNCEGLVKNISWSQTKFFNDTLTLTLHEQERCPGRIWKPSVAVGDKLCIRFTPTESIHDIANNRCIDCIYIDGDFGDSGGPVVSNVLANGVSPLQMGVGSPQVEITCDVSDATTGNSDVVFVELFVNLAGVPETGTPMIMNPAYAIDVSASYVLPTTSWAKGTYTIYVHGKDSSGFWGDFETVVIYVGEESMGCLYPPDFDGVRHAIDERTCGEIRLDWDEATDINQPISYRIYESRYEALYDFANPTYTTEDLSYKVSGLDNNLPYYYVVRAIDSCGNEDHNFVELMAYASDGEAPYFEGIQELNSLGCASLELIWTPATDDVAGCSSDPIIYNIYVAYNRKGQNYSAPSFETTAEDGVILSGLQHDQDYFIVVRAQDSAADYSGTISGFDATVLGGNIDTLIDADAEWPDNVLVGSEVYPNVHRNESYMIIENTKTTLTITPGYDLDTEATVGSIFWVKGRGNEDDNKVELQANADFIISNDEESWWLENLEPASGATVMNADHLEFDIIDDCFGIDKDTIQLIIVINQTQRALITDIWGGYHVEYYPEDYYLSFDNPYFAGEIEVSVMAAENADFSQFRNVTYTFTALLSPEED